MTPFEPILSCPWALRLGWVLVHSVWQIGTVGVLITVALRLLDRRFANHRNLVACRGLTAMLVALVATYWLVAAPVPPEMASVSIPMGKDGESSVGSVGVFFGSFRSLLQRITENGLLLALVFQKALDALELGCTQEDHVFADLRRRNTDRFPGFHRLALLLS